MIEWLTTTNHKKIGIMYIVAVMCFFAAAGILALLIRAQLAVPDNTLLVATSLQRGLYPPRNRDDLPRHRAVRIGLANYLIPLQIGAPDVAFPRLNATGLWLFVFGGLTVFAGWRRTAAPRRQAGPHTLRSTNLHEGTGAGQDLWFIGLLMVERLDDPHVDQLAR